MSNETATQPFAVIETGGKQYIVTEGETIDVELLAGDYKEGDEVRFDRVLVTDNGSDTHIGTPYVEGAAVRGVYRGEKKGKKLSIIRFKAKSNRDRNVGHRQKYSRVEITSVA